MPPNRLLSLTSERNIIDVAQSENCTHVNFRLCNVYYVVRPAKQKTDTKFFLLEIAKQIFKRKNFCLFSHFRWSNTQATQAREACENMQSRVTFPDFSSPCSFIAKVTQPFFGVVVVYALLCYSAKSEFTFHVKHCKSKLKFFNIMSVRKRK